MTTKRRSWMDVFDYEGPVGEGPGGWSVSIVDPKDDPMNTLSYVLEGRPPGSGPFHVLRHNGSLWMSDTDAELRDHVEPLWKTRKAVDEHGHASVLIHGLGLGLVVAASIRTGADVDVVEIDGDLIAWQGVWLGDLAREHGVAVNFHEADALKKKWPPGSYWDVVWHDIWPTISLDNDEQMKFLNRSFGRRCGWQGSWGRTYLQRMKRDERSGWW